MIIGYLDPWGFLPGYFNLKALLTNLVIETPTPHLLCMCSSVPVPGLFHGSI